VVRTTETAAIVATVDANRSLGAVTAPWRLEFAIDVYCPHCAAEHADLLKALTPLTGPRLRLVTRHLVRRSAPHGAELARYLLAAAAVDANTFHALVVTLLGTRPNQDWPGVRTFVADALDVARIEAMERQHREVLAGLVKDDMRELRERAMVMTTPALALVEVSSGRTVRTWTGTIDAVQMVKAITAATRNP
jgi:hypothetical protein